MKVRFWLYRLRAWLVRRLGGITNGEAAARRGHDKDRGGETLRSCATTYGKEDKDMSLCKGCGAGIIWIQTAGGKMMPVDKDPVWVKEGPEGESFIQDDGYMITGERVEEPPADIAQEEELEYVVAYVPHWSSCPQAGRFRRRA